MSDGVGLGRARGAMTVQAIGYGDRGRDELSIGDLVSEVTRALGCARVGDPAREARDIVATLLDVPYSWPSAYAHRAADSSLVCRARTAAERRGRGMPLPYAVGRAAFRHLTLDVDERVLVPRPETEGLVDLVLAECRLGGVAIDVGTGSGAIALALAQEGTFGRVIGTDVSLDALAVAAGNARRLTPTLAAAVEFRAGAYLAPVRGIRARAVISNPPYISWAEASRLPTGVRDWEPSVALFTGDAGMAATAAVVREAADTLEQGGMLALEVDARRATQAAALVTADGRYVHVVVRQDLFGRERYLTAIRRSGT
jgi:release factor glutamine methyltransferase